MPVEEYAGLAAPGAALANDRYIEEATALGERALRSALASAGLEPAAVDLLIVTSVTGVAVPSLDARLIPRLGLRPDIKRLPVFGLGCVAGAAGLARLHDYLLAWPGHVAALLSVELCTLTVPRTKVTTADLVASALFGDGAAAVVATGEQAAVEEATARQSCIRPGYFPGDRYQERGLSRTARTALGWRLAADGFRIVLTAELADVVERRLNGSVTAFLAGARPDGRRHRKLDLPSRRAGEGARRRATRAQAAMDSALAASRQVALRGSATWHRSPCCTSWSCWRRPSRAGARIVRDDDRTRAGRERRAPAAEVVTP